MNVRTFFWPPIERVPPTGSGDVHVYAWDLDVAPVAADWAILSEEEAARARRFVFPRDRDRFVRAHAAMRRVLGEHCGVEPAGIVFSNGRYEKPQVEGVKFNLSHSAGVAVLAVAPGYHLGVDVELVRPIEADVAEHHFSPDELATLRSLPTEQWLTGFYRCWTSKEALLKGEGCGLNLALDGFDVEADPNRAPGLLASRLPGSMKPGWLLVDLKPAPGAVGALAVRDETGRFSAREVCCFSING